MRKLYITAVLKHNEFLIFLAALAKQFGDGASEPDFLMTLHVIVRSPFSRKVSLTKEPKSSIERSCWCSIS
jgi:hypothetical protein